MANSINEINEDVRKKENKGWLLLAFIGIFLSILGIMQIHFTNLFLPLGAIAACSIPVTIFLFKMEKGQKK